MASIWDMDDDNNSAASSKKPEQPIVKMDSGAEVDLLQRDSVKMETENLFNSLKICDDIVVEAFQITDYIPTLTNKEMAEFWNNQIGNPNRDIQKQFYEAIIKERVARIKANNKDQDEQQAVQNELSQSLCEYQAKYKTTRDSMVEFEKTFREEMDKIQQEIDSLTNRLQAAYTGESEAAITTGLQGENFNKFLELVTNLKTDIHQGANAYRPLESALTGILLRLLLKFELTVHC
ncbi:unnamed protein product [Rotaria sp. Silwood1]|nr:unnamed protein product [Rotaria sp. Silwood1]CAF1530241.1 unnamed protein product [Rotaria sp. Silwood1]